MYQHGRPRTRFPGTGTSTGHFDNKHIGGPTLTTDFRRKAQDSECDILLVYRSPPKCRVIRSLEEPSRELLPLLFCDINRKGEYDKWLRQRSLIGIH